MCVCECEWLRERYVSNGKCVSNCTLSRGVEISQVVAAPERRRKSDCFSCMKKSSVCMYACMCVFMSVYANVCELHRKSRA